MNDHRAGKSTEPFPSTGRPSKHAESEYRAHDDGDGRRPEGWRPVPTGIRGARLYRISALEGGECHWVVEMSLNGALQRRRCASELYARWWLASLVERDCTPRQLDWEELNEPWRAAFARGE